MPTTPILAIEQVSASQNQKEVTINDAVLALENATNRKLIVSFASSASILLSDSQATRNMMFEASGATSDATLRIPNTVNGQNFSRVIVVRNNSGQVLTVKFNTGAGSTVAIPDGEARLLAAMDGLNVTVAAEPATTATFLSLTDTPSSYATFGGKVLAVKSDATGLEFIDTAIFPTLAGNAGKVLAVKSDLSGVEWVPVVTSFTSLTDTPASYTSAAGKIIAVKTDESGLEYIDVPEAEAVEYTAATRWRVRTISPGTDPSSVAYGEVDFLNRTGLSLVGTGTPQASSFDTGKEAAYAFDDSFSFGSGWFSAVGDLTGSWIGYEFLTAQDVRSVRLWPVEGFPEYAPTQIIIERWNGSAWIAAGEYLPDEWVSGTAQTFKVLGTPLSSISEAPDDGETYARESGTWVNIAERVRDVIAAALVEGDDIEIVVNDASNTFTFSLNGTTVAERIRDTVAAMIVPGTNVTVDYDDTADTFTINASGGGGGGGSGVPNGGLTGQVLSKLSDTDGDADWQDISDLTVVTPIPTVRGSSIVSSSAGSYVVTWPAGTVAGDRIVIFGGHGFALSATPSGWTALENVAGTNWNGFVITRVVTSADITAGSVTITLGGTFNGVIAAVTLVGAPDVKRFVSARNGSGGSPRTLSLDGAVSTDDLTLLFGSNRNASTNTIDIGTTLQSINATAASGVLKSVNASAGQTASFTYGTTTGTTGDYQVALVLSFPTRIIVGGNPKFRTTFLPRTYEPSLTNYATLDFRNGHPVLDFDATTQEAAMWRDVLGEGYANTGLTVEVFVALSTATTGTVGFDGAFERIDLSTLDIDADSFGTAKTFTATAVPATSGQVLKLTATFAHGAEIDGLVAGELFRFRLRRDVASDTATGDAEVLAVVVRET